MEIPGFHNNFTVHTPTECKKAVGFPLIEYQIWLHLSMMISLPLISGLVHAKVVASKSNMQSSAFNIESSRSRFSSFLQPWIIGSSS